jgi:hypothetical protein
MREKEKGQREKEQKKEEKLRGERAGILRKKCESL